MMYLHGTRKTLDHLINHGVKVYQYIFSYLGKNSLACQIKRCELGVNHAEELEYIWKFENPWKEDLDLNEEDSAMRFTITTAWTNFAKTGDPGLSWMPQTNYSEPHYLNINSVNPVMECAQDIKDRMEVWDKVLTHYNESGKNASVNTKLGNDTLNNTESGETTLSIIVSEKDGLASNKSAEVELDNTDSIKNFSSSTESVEDKLTSTLSAEDVSYSTKASENDLASNVSFKDSLASTESDEGVLTNTVVDNDMSASAELTDTTMSNIKVNRYGLVSTLSDEYSLASTKSGKESPSGAESLSSTKSQNDASTVTESGQELLASAKAARYN